MSIGLTLLQSNIAYLVIASAEDEFGVGVVVQNALDNLALVDSDRTHFKILLAHKHYDHPSVRVPSVFSSSRYIPSIGRFRAKLFSSRS